MSPATLTNLRLHLRAWKRHGIHFGCPHHRLSLCHGTFSAACVSVTREAAPPDTGPFGMQLALRIAGDMLVYRYPYCHTDFRKRGERNPRFLEASEIQEFIHRLPPKSPTIIFPVDYVYRTEGMDMKEFMGKLARFFDLLPKGFRYAVEIQNSEYLFPQYFVLLARYGVTHVMNDPATMPSILDQIQLPRVFTSDQVIVRTTACRKPEWQLGIVETVRRCLDEKKQLLVFLADGEYCNAETALQRLTEILNPDLAKLSPLRRKAA